MENNAVIFTGKLRQNFDIFRLVVTELPCVLLVKGYKKFIEKFAFSLPLFSC